MFKMLNPRRFYHAVGKRRFWEFIVLAAFLLFFYGPMVNMFMLAFANKYDAPSVFPQAWGFKYWRFVFSQENLVSSIGQSFLIALITMTVAIAIVVAYLLALYLRFVKSPISRAIGNLYLIPRFVPSLVAVYAMITVIRDSGLVNRISQSFGGDLKLGM